MAAPESLKLCVLVQVQTSQPVCGTIVYRRGRHPFKVKRRVRFPLVLPSCLCGERDIIQRFERCVAGSNPAGDTSHAVLAQLAERHLGKMEVVGSSPTRGSIIVNVRDSHMQTWRF